MGSIHVYYRVLNNKLSGPDECKSYVQLACISREAFVWCYGFTVSCAYRLTFFFSSTEVKVIHHIGQFIYVTIILNGWALYSLPFYLLYCTITPILRVPMFLNLYLSFYHHWPTLFVFFMTPLSQLNKNITIESLIVMYTMASDSELSFEGSHSLLFDLFYLFRVMARNLRSLSYIYDSNWWLFLLGWLRQPSHSFECKLNWQSFG